MSDDDFDEPDFDSDSTVDTSQKQQLEPLDKLVEHYHPKRLQYIQQNKINFALT